MTLDVEELRGLLDDAASTPWRAEWHGQDYAVLGQNGSDKDFPIFAATYAINPRSQNDRDECDTSDADLAIAAVNSLQPLLDEQEKLLAVLEAARVVVSEAEPDEGLEGYVDYIVPVPQTDALRAAIDSWDKRGEK